MDSVSYKKKFSMYYYYFRGKNRSHEESEDFASWAIMKELLGRKTKIRFMYIDYVRQFISDDRNSTAKLKKSVFYAKKYEERDFIEQPEDYLQNMYHFAIYQILKKELSKRNFEIITMYSRGYKLTEIQKKFNLKRKNIKNILNKTFEIIRSFI